MLDDTITPLLQQLVVQFGNCALSDLELCCLTWICPMKRLGKPLTASLNLKAVPR